MNTEEFIKHASADTVLSQRMAAAATPEEAYEVAQEAGLTDDLDRFCQVMEACRDQVSEISEEDLEGLNAAGAGTVATRVTGSVMAAGMAAVL